MLIPLIDDLFKATACTPDQHSAEVLTNGIVHSSVELGSAIERQKCLPFLCRLLGTSKVLLQDVYFRAEVPSPPLTSPSHIPANKKPLQIFDVYFLFFNSMRRHFEDRHRNSGTKRHWNCRLPRQSFRALLNICRALPM